MRVITRQDLMDWGACDSIDLLPLDWTGTPIELLDEPVLSFTDVMWGAARVEFMSERGLRSLLHYTCSFITFPDSRSTDALGVLLTYTSEDDIGTARILAWLVVEEATTDEDRVTARIAANALKANPVYGVNGVMELVSGIVTQLDIINKTKEIILDYDVDE